MLALTRKSRPFAVALTLACTALLGACQEEGTIEGSVEGPRLALDGDQPVISRTIRACPAGVFLGAIDSAELDIEVDATLADGSTSTFRLQALLTNNGQRNEEAPVSSGAAAQVDVGFTAYHGLGLGELCKEGVSISFEQAGQSALDVSWTVFGTFTGASDDVSGATVQLSIE